MRNCTMRSTLLVTAFTCFAITLFAQTNDKANSNSIISKDTKVSTKEVKAAVKNGSITKDEGKQALREIRENRKQLRESKRKP